MLNSVFGVICDVPAAALKLDRRGRDSLCHSPATMDALLQRRIRNFLDNLELCVTLQAFVFVYWHFNISHRSALLYQSSDLYQAAEIASAELRASERLWLQRCRSLPLISTHPLAILLFGMSAGGTSFGTICFLPGLEEAISLFGFPLR